MKHHHEEGRGPRGRHGEHGEHCGHGRSGGEHCEHGRRGDEHCEHGRRGDEHCEHGRRGGEHCEHGRRGGEHCEHGRRGGGRRQRFFGHGELRLVILDILTHNTSHGYELIKEIETMTQGSYSPSPGVIYPTLDLLQDQGLISVAEENGRKKIAITAEGSQLHAENQEQLEHIQTKLQARMVGCELRKNPPMKRALENFKAVLDLKVNQQTITEAQLKQIIAVIDRAAMEISQLD